MFLLYSDLRKMRVTCLLLVVFGGNTFAMNWAGGSKSDYTFPKDFLFGVSTSAPQVEGAWNIDGRTESIWDHMAHTTPEFIKDRSNGDVASDSYHQYKRDVELLRELGVNVYRFSISWSRVLPTGHVNNINPHGIPYYRNLIDELIKYNIAPMVTIYHWDMPQKLQDIGGWTNAHIVDYFTDYSKVLFDNFADKVKYWVTINEPKHMCLSGYGDDVLAPALNRHGLAEYLCVHNALKAHASVYHLFDQKYRHINNGKIGVSIVSNWVEPKSKTDRKTADLFLNLDMGWSAHPVFSTEGNYPPELIKLVDLKSQSQNYSRSRLPKFTEEVAAYIRGTADFFGVNHYTTHQVSKAHGEIGAIPSNKNDLGINRDSNLKWPSSPTGLNIAPFGFRRMLHWISKNYKNVPIIITEIGYDDAGKSELDDSGRVSYFEHYLNALLHAMHEDKCNIQGFIARSLIDSFELTQGYRPRHGLYHVDFESPNKTRKAKQSARFYSGVVANRRLPEDYDPSDFTAFSGAPHLTPAMAITMISIGFMIKTFF